MPIQRFVFRLSFALILASSTLFGQQAPRGKLENAIGKENAQMAQRTGVWDVTETVWESPTAAPLVTKWVAERRMIGEFLEEILEPAVGASPEQIQRIDYLSYHRIEGRWKYVSMDTRASVGMMPASSTERGDTTRIHLRFEPFAIPIEGSKAGQLLVMEETIIQSDANHDSKEQYFNLSDGNGTLWLKHKYEYARHQAK